MANPEHVERLLKGPRAWNAWREGVTSRPDLRDADLRGADLTRADLIGADLRGADVSGATLRSAMIGMGALGNVTLDNADLAGADLTGADLRTGMLRGATFTCADLRGADFSGADVENAEFSFARLGNTTFTRCDVARARGLARCVHHMPSNLDYETLRRAGSRVPPEFLRGCGLEDWEIAVGELYGRDLSRSDVDAIVKRIAERRTAVPEHPPRVFISYNWGDASFVRRLENRLIASGWHVRQGVHHPFALPIERQIAEAVREQDLVVLVLSTRTTSAAWGAFDGTHPRATDRIGPGRDVLWPIALDDSWQVGGSDACERLIRPREVLDFSDWKRTETFDAAFGRLLRRMKICHRAREAATST